MTVSAKRQTPLKVDPATDELISHAAHFLGMTKKDLVAEAARAYLDQRREPRTGCAPGAWFPEYALPERELLPAEQAWSNIMDPKAAAQLLRRPDRRG